MRAALAGLPRTVWLLGFILRAAREQARKGRG